MPTLDLHMEGDNCWPDLREKGYIGAEIAGIAGLPNGTEGGKPTVTIRVELPDGRTVLAETTLHMFLTAADALRAHYRERKQ